MPLPRCLLSLFTCLVLHVLITHSKWHKKSSDSDIEELKSYKLKDILEWDEPVRYIRYDSRSKTLCEPESACKGIDIMTIPFIFDHVSERFINTQHLYDTTAVNKCLKNKRLTLLGDTTMTEVANDLAVLMSGLAADKNTLQKFLFRTTHVDQTVADFKLMNHVRESYYGNHRNLTVYSEETNTHIRSRFIGHYDLKKEGYGILTLIEDRFQDELNCLLGFNGCPVPNVVIINSGYHDRKHPIKQFQKVVFQFLHDLKGRYAKEKLNVDIIWAGTIIGTRKWKVMEDLDNIAEKVTSSLRIPYMNSTDVIQYVPQFQFYPGMYTPDYIHYGSIAKQIDKNITGAVSMLKTQRLLQEICTRQIKKEISKGYERTVHIQVV